jgi:hypothetical protein
LHQKKLLEAHALHGTRGSADVAGMRGLDQDYPDTLVEIAYHESL